MAKEAAGAVDQDRAARLAALDEEIRLVELETKKAQLAQARRGNEEFALTEEQRTRLADQAQRNLRAERRNQEARTAACSHLTGGFGNEDTLTGDGKPMLITVELPIAGTKMIICGRCLGDWRTPDASLKKTNPKLYAEQCEEWRDILKLERQSLSKPMAGPAFSFHTEDGVPVIPELK